MVVSFLVKVEYFQIFIYLVVASLIGFLIIFLSYWLISKKSYTHKLAPYECGFDPFGDARSLFNVHFYLVGILFIIFDLELMFLFPWAMSLQLSRWVGFFSMAFFLGVLTLGFIYEWRKGALSWN